MRQMIVLEIGLSRERTWLLNLVVLCSLTIVDIRRLLSLHIPEARKGLVLNEIDRVGQVTTIPAKIFIIVISLEGLLLSFYWSVVTTVKMVLILFARIIVKSHLK